ncbi:putative secreted lipase [Vanrija pseudolonga]|uniref:Carboxylic ester hydrolase n=1 Tax=Vanrija pseudolonga TaxID=143232 RepID=A0AAF1BK60_9TREE|nr:putative secreted lipase [Vanrija pseudolonga]
MLIPTLLALSAATVNLVAGAPAGLLGLDLGLDLNLGPIGLGVDVKVDIPDGTNGAPGGSFLTVPVSAPAGTLYGLNRLTTEAFTGIPFAQPPVGQLRLAPPVRLTTPLNNFDATQQSAACPQFLSSTKPDDLPSTIADIVVNKTPFLQQALKVSEDCLNLNIFRPAGTKAGDNLPVLFWMYGGGFEVGERWFVAVVDSPFVAATAAFGKPLILVAVNYRIGGFGFLAGKEIKAAGASNLGLLDQRLGLEWVADNIVAFGGDPSKVTIWGESAGAISVFNQFALLGGDYHYKGQPLFRGGIMNSGSIVPAQPVDSPKAQAVFDAVVAETSCKGSADVINCLRALPYDQYLNAVNSRSGLFSYTSIALAYFPRPDGKVLTDSPEVLAKSGRFAPVPFIVGDQEDEGTLFSLFQQNTTGSTDALANYLNTVTFPGASRELATQLVNLYPEDPAAGSPFRTGILNEWYPGFKRLAAILGDATFTLLRRIFLKYAIAAHPDVPAWSYLASYAYLTPILGTFHTADVLVVYNGIPPSYASVGIQKYYANFVYNLDPNNAAGGKSTASKVADNWPRWDAVNKPLLQFNLLNFAGLKDDFRQAAADLFEANLTPLRA